MTPLRPSAAWLVALAFAAAAPVLAERPSTPKLLAQAQEQVDAGEFESALITLQDALASPDNSNDDLGAIYWRMGEVYVFTKRERDAGEAFERLLYLAPDWQPPRLTSPHVKRTFEQSRAAFEKGDKQISLALSVPPIVRAGEPIGVEAKARGLGPGRTARIYFRRALSEAWVSAELEPAAGDPGTLRAQLPAFPAGTGLEYYAEITGTDRRRLTGEGSSLAPKSLRVARAAPERALAPPTERKPAPAAESGTPGWVFAVIGGVAIVGAGAAYYALSPEPATLRARVTVTP